MTRAESAPAESPAPDGPVLLASDLPRAPLRRTTVLLLVILANVAVVGAVVVAGPAAAALVPVALGVVVVLPRLVIGLVRRPQRGVLLLAALLPFNGLLVVLPFPDWANAWKETLVLVVLGATFVAPASARGLPGRRLPGWATALGAFFVLALVSAVVQHDLQAAVGIKVGFFYVLIAVTVWRCPLDASERDHLVSILMALGVLTAVVGILQEIAGAERLVELGWEYNTNVRFAGSWLRAFSTFNTNFSFAMFLMVVLLVGVPAALVDWRRARNTAFLVCVPVVLAGIVVSFTRTAWVGLAVGLVYLAVTRVRAMSVVLVRILVVGLIALVFVGDYAATFLSERSSQERVTLWTDNLANVTAHPFGVGVGATGSAAERVAELSDTSKSDTIQPDNYYLKTTIELGVLGLWVFVLLLLAIFLGVHRIAGGLPPPDEALARGTAAMVLAAAVASAAATYFEVYPMDAYFWLLVAVVATCAPETFGRSAAPGRGLERGGAPACDPESR